MAVDDERQKPEEPEESEEAAERSSTSDDEDADRSRAAGDEASDEQDDGDGDDDDDADDAADDDSPAAEAGEGHRAPAWLVPLYVGGLVLVYIGERIVATMETGRWLVSGLGLSCVVAATLLRFVPGAQAKGERGRIDRLLGILSLIGVFALLLYLLSTDWGLERLGLAQAEDEVRNQVQGLLTLAWVVLICISLVPMLFAEAALYPMRNAERMESRRVRAAAASGAILSLAAVYGSLFVYAADGADWKVDFSYFKTSEPSESTKKLVHGLGQPIKVTAFFPDVSPVRREVEGYLNALAADVPNLQVEIHDRYLRPQLARDLKVVRDGIIVIQKGEAKRTVHLGPEMDEARPKLKTLDRDFQERLYKLLRSRRTIYLTVGHGEINDTPRGVAQQRGRSARILKTLLGKQHYLVKNLGLTQGLATDVPDDADIVMVLGPTEPFAPEEIASLERYANRGGKLFIALDPDAVSAQEVALLEDAAGVEPASAEANEGKEGTAQPKEQPPPAPRGSAAKPQGPEEGQAEGDDAQDPEPAAAPPGSALAGLQALAGVVGVKLNPTILANDRQYVRRRYNDSDRTMLITNRFSSHASVSTLSRNSSRAAVLVSGAGALERASGTTAKVDIAVRAMSSTFADENRNYQFDDSTEKRQSYGLAVAVSKPVNGNKAPEKKEPDNEDDEKNDKKIEDVPTPNELRAFVMADADALTDLIMGNFMTNQLLTVDAVRWLGGEESFAGEVNVEEDVRIEHTQQKDLVWFYATIFGVPALVLGVGLTFSRRSRRPRGGKK